LEVRDSRAHVAHLPQEDGEFIEPLPPCRFFQDGVTDQFQTLLVPFREWDRVELPQRLDLRIIEGLDEPMAVVRLLPQVVLQLLELSLVLRQDERILVDRSDLLVHSGEGLLRAGLLLAALSPLAY